MMYIVASFFFRYDSKSREYSFVHYWVVFRHQFVMKMKGNITLLANEKIHLKNTTLISPETKHNFSEFSGM